MLIKTPPITHKTKRKLRARLKLLFNQCVCAYRNARSLNAFIGKRVHFDAEFWEWSRCLINKLSVRSPSLCGHCFQSQSSVDARKMISFYWVDFANKHTHISWCNLWAHVVDDIIITYRLQCNVPYSSGPLTQWHSLCAQKYLVHTRLSIPCTHHTSNPHTHTHTLMPTYCADASNNRKSHRIRGRRTTQRTQTNANRHIKLLSHPPTNRRQAVLALLCQYIWNTVVIHLYLCVLSIIGLNM